MDDTCAPMSKRQFFVSLNFDRKTNSRWLLEIVTQYCARAQSVSTID